jgi:thiol:disulfide interchange protein DsbG
LLPKTQQAGQQAVPVAVAAGGKAALEGKYTGPIPEPIQAIDKLAGIKEGSGGAADTLYIIFDPRCPYCRKAYLQTRDYVKKGYSIKWIPAVALGNPDEGIPLSATILQAKPAEQAAILARVLGNKEPIKTAPTKASEEALARSVAFLFAAFENSGRDQAGVPAGFFLDKRTGKARMLTGVSESVILEDIFGKK